MADELREFHADGAGQVQHPVESLQRAFLAVFSTDEPEPTEREEVIITVWRVPRRLANREFTQLHRLLVERYGAVGASSVGQGSRRAIAAVMLADEARQN